MNDVPLFPNSVKTFFRLWPALGVIYEGLEFGAFKAVEYFVSQNCEVNPYLAASLARFNARRAIEARADKVPIALEDIPNIGLRMTYQEHGLWILKNDDGDLPTPGSPIKEEYYNQVLPLLMRDPEQPVVKPNLVILWSAPKSYATVTLKLVCPKSGNLNEAATKSYWDLRIPHPAELINFTMPPDADAATQEELDEIEQILFSSTGGSAGGDE